MKICHMTCAHPSNDVRIFVKECSSLAAAGNEVYLVAQGDIRTENDVHVVGLGAPPKSRLARMTAFARKAYRTALELDCEVYHLHDPELLPYGLKLKSAGKKIIFDSHEDVPGQILDKDWIPAPLRKAVSRAYRAYETHCVRRLDAIVAATPHIGKQFEGRARRIAVVNNFPRLDDIVFHNTAFSDRPAQLCYAGGISHNRGDGIMRAAMQDVDGRLVIAGAHAPETIGNVEYAGMLGRAGVNALYGSSVAGLCILKPIRNYYDSQPIKMFEYMAAGLPFICSDFPGWRRVAQESGAGICVDPGDTAAIAAAIRRLLTDRETAQAMGRLGREYVIAHCTWKNEEQTLLALYEALLKGSKE